ncbi:hybrid sensor histidine kinase/response regulator [Stenotrophomonas lactitubi]|uniref:hybrid sensor histidine kinase/response regulator n=1 Tax=Stenotrophomonas lactitubi TaxID=2045214 RepID=UPI001DB142BE|nr:hybrid sensor histidine kinase/response regulator [Stenotrophomonas lactitubi]CAH0130566.1 Sensor histidine kinase RcsC [Stenotrophomonas lactitubi]
MHPAAPAAPINQIDALRRLQRRLLFGGGGLISILIVLTAVASLVGGIGEFHSRERQTFQEAQSALDYFLSQRDRAYANSINANDALWTDQHDELRRLGSPLLTPFLAQGQQLVVRAEGRASVPWLVLGNPAQPMPTGELEAYLGMLHEYSAYTAATITALQTQGPIIMYAYEPKGRLLAVAGVIDEAQLLQTLRVPTRAQAFEKLMQMEAAVGDRIPAPGPVAGAAQGRRLVSFLGDNPLNGQPALIGVMTMARADVPYFRRVVFESIDNLKGRLEATDPGSYLVTTGDGRVVLAGGPLAQSPATLAAALSDARSAAGQRQYHDGWFLVSGSLRGVDWRLTHLYGWADLWREQHAAILLRVFTALLILAALWILLWRMDRRVFAPALADASRVYESEALSQAIIGTAPVGLALLRRRDGAALLQNQVARELVGESGQDEAVPELYAQLIAHARGLPARGGEFNWALDAGTDDARQLQVALAVANYHDQPVWVCAMRDATAQVELQHTLQQARQDSERAREAAEAASRAKTAFVATMSHEIRTPLNGVLGHLELLARSPLQPDQHERLQRIRLSADSLMAIISDVLDFSKIEAGQLDIDPLPFALRPLIEQAALLYAPEAQRKDVKLYFAIDPSLDEAFIGDVHRIRQILNNLLSNAVKFTASGRITLRAEDGGGTGEERQLRLQVVDSGIGLSEEQVTTLFRPFQQGDASVSRRYGGSGLGLALCQQLAQLLGGRIQVQSTLGVGSVFTLDVPVQRTAVAAASDQPLSGRRISLLSSAQEWRQEIGQLLHRWGADVTVIERPADGAPGTALLIFGERRAWTDDEELAVLPSYARVVRAYPRGPLSPEQRDDAVHVSCYASPALLQALRGESMPLPWTHDAAPRTGVRRTRGRVLLVEDNPVNRELIQQQLEELDCQVDAMENGQVALTGWQSGAWDIVMTDINMPVLDGYQLARALRGRGETLPILAVTATALASERERCRAAGIDDLLLKPLDLARLLAMLDRYLQVLPSPPRPLSPAGKDKPHKLRALFVESSTRDLDRMQAAGESSDDAALLEQLHALKGVLLMMGEKPLGARFGDAERLLREGQSLPEHERVALLSDLRDLIEAYRDGLRDGA